MLKLKTLIGCEIKAVYSDKVQQLTQFGVGPRRLRYATLIVLSVAELIGLLAWDVQGYWAMGLNLAILS